MRPIAVALATLVACQSAPTTSPPKVRVRDCARPPDLVGDWYEFPPGDLNLRFFLDANGHYMSGAYDFDVGEAEGFWCVEQTKVIFCRGDGQQCTQEIAIQSGELVLAEGPHKGIRLRKQPERHFWNDPDAGVR